jgi:hypothetical protein
MSTQIPDGWKLVSAPDAEVVILEQILSGRARRAFGNSLAHAVSDALDLEQRLADHPDFVRSAFGNPATGRPAVGGSTEPKADPQDDTAPVGVGISDLAAGRSEPEPESDPRSRSDLTPGR